MAPLQPTDLGTVLGVWAHPDDEAYLSGALMAACAAAGQRVVCVTATRGEGGSQDPERWPPEKMAEIRTAEMARCLEILGVSEHHWLDYVDGTCHEVSLTLGTAKVRAILEDVRPDTVLTFGPDGMTGHADHKSVSAWATEAFKEAAQGGRLLYATQTQAWVDEFEPMLRPFNVYEEPPPVTPEDELTVAFRPAGDLLETKVRALLAQESQVEGMFRVFGEENFRRAVGSEFFRLAASA